MGVLRPISLDPKRGHPGAGVGFDRHEMIIAREQRFEIFAPEQDPRKPRDEIALRPAEDRPQVIFLLELANRVTRHDKVLHGAVSSAARPNPVDWSSAPIPLVCTCFGLRTMNLASDR